jgi:inner membrane protein
MTSFGGLALLPDLDVAGLSMGLSDSGLYGHRGYSHSLTFAVAVAGLVWWWARRWGTRPAFSAVLAFLAVASHGILDAMTYRTRGIPFFWPLTDVRVAFPWRPIPPAPTGVKFLSLRGLEVTAVEAVYFTPLMVLACLPGIATWKRWLRWERLLPRREPAALLAPIAAPVPVAAPVFSARQASFRVAGIIAAVALSLAAAQVYLRESRIVAWIEQSTHDGLAVSMARRPHRHMR